MLTINMWVSPNQSSMILWSSKSMLLNKKKGASHLKKGIMKLWFFVGQGYKVWKHTWRLKV